MRIIRGDVDHMVEIRFVHDIAGNMEAEETAALDVVINLLPILSRPVDDHSSIDSVVQEDIRAEIR